VVEPPDLVDAVTADAKAAVASYVAAGLPD
jgi:hypothetical protein